MFSTLFIKTNIYKILGFSLALILIPALVLTFFSSTNNFESLTKNKQAGAAGPNTGDLIIGTKDTGNAVELSVCVKATLGPFRLSQVSNWFKFDPTVLTPTPATFLEKGQYGNTVVGLNGYSPIKWQEVAGTFNNTTLPNSDTFTMSLAYGGDPATPGLAGLFMNTSAPELFGRVSFTKVPNATGSTAINMVKNQFFTIENGIALIQQVISVTGDCRNSVCPVNTTSLNGYIAPNPCTSTCVAGTSFNATTSSCDPCPAGYSCAGTINPPVQCPVNTYCPPSSPTPLPCPVNTTSPAGSLTLNSCVSNCTVGSYLNTSSACVSCPSNTSTPSGSTGASSCTSTCVAGTSFNATTSSCDPCPAGYSCAGTINPPVQCPVNTYCPNGTTTPIPCLLGKTSPVGSTSIVACITPVCTNGATNSPACTICPAGTSYVTTSSSCAACTLGQYCPGPLPPVICPANSYCPTPGPAPTPCPAGQTSPAGSTSVSACITPACANGATNSPACTLCPAGSYINNSNCTLCPVNFACIPLPCNPNCPPVIPTPCPVGTSAPAGSISLASCVSNIVGGGGVIVITNISSSSNSNSSSISSALTSTVAIQNNVFKSKLRITDPYICGKGSYGNVPDHSKFGVDFVFYDFYKLGSSAISYSYKLKLNGDGDFFLPISQQTNNIAQGNYRVEFYAIDKDGGKAQGQYDAYITQDCGGQHLESELDKVNTNKYDSVRTGGLSAATILILLTILASFVYSYQKSKTKKLIYEAKNTDEF
jgi:hypothetical protein